MLEDLHISLTAEELFSIGPFPFTNSFLMMLIVMAFILLVGRWIAANLSDVPGRKQGAVEIVVEFLLNLAEGAGGKTLGRQVFPLVGALFIFILLANYSGLLPGVGTIGVYHEYEEEHAEEARSTYSELASAGVIVAQNGEDQETGEEAEITTGIEDPEPAGDEAHAEEHHETLVPFFRPPNADLNMTIAMALVSFVTVQVLGVRYSGGIGGRLKHMAQPAFMFPIELVSELSRVISLSARLFGNVFAGEVLLTVMFTLAAVARYAVIPLAVPVVFLGLELLFGFIQALVFALLTLIYIALAAAGHHGDDHAHEEAHHATPQTAAHPAPSAGD